MRMSVGLVILRSSRGSAGLHCLLDACGRVSFRWSLYVIRASLGEGERERDASVASFCSKFADDDSVVDGNRQASVSSEVQRRHRSLNVFAVSI